MKHGLDAIDLKILRILQEDARTSNVELARKVSLSPPSTSQRLAQLEKEGVIAKYAAVLDRAKVGYDLVVVAMVGLALHQERPIEQFRRAATKIPQVLECLHVSGDYDFMLKVVAKDMADYERFVSEELSAIKGVGKIHSCFVLAVNKSTTSLPI